MCSCIRGVVGCVDSIPFGGVLAGALVAISGIVTYSGALILGPVLDLFAEHLEVGTGFGSQGLQYVYAVHIIILLVAIPVAWRGVVAEARINGFKSFGLRRCMSCVPCCEWLFTSVWSLAVTALLWACVLLAVPVLCIAEAFYLLLGVLFFQACEGYPDSPDHNWDTILSTILAVLDAANQPPLSAGIDFSLTVTTKVKLVDDCCSHRDELRDSTLRILVGGVGLLFAVVLLLTHWAKYSKAWQHAAYRNYQPAAPTRVGPPARRSRTEDYELDEV